MGVEVLIVSPPTRHGQVFKSQRVVLAWNRRIRLTVHVDDSYPEQSRILSEVWTDNGWTLIYRYQPQDFMEVPEAYSRNDEIQLPRFDRMFDRMLTEAGRVLT